MRLGADGEPLDVYLGPDDTADFAFVVNQLKQDGSFDEHKILLGFNTVHDAVKGYLAHMPPDWTGYDPIRVMTLPELRHWLRTGDQTRKVAGSYTPAEVPKNFWVAISLDSEGETFKDIEFGQLSGISGISASPEIIDAFLPHADAFLRLPGPDTERVNSLTQVLYNSPDYLMSKNMAALRRVSGGGDIIHLILQTIIPPAAAEGFRRWLHKNHKDPVANSVAEFERKVLALASEHDAEKESGDSPSMALHLQPGQPTEALNRFLQNVMGSYGHEHEWLLKNKALNIPPGTYIGILLPGAFNEVAEAQAYYTQLVEKHGGDPMTAYNSVVNPANRELIWRMFKAFELREKVRGRYTVGFVIKDRFTPMALERNKQRQGERERGVRPTFKGIYQQVAAWKGKTAAPEMTFEHWFNNVLGGWNGVDANFSSIDHYWETAADELGNEKMDRETRQQKVDARARELLLEDLKDSWEDWSYKYRYLLKFPARLYRAVDLDNPSALKTEGIGIYWTDSPSHAIAHWGGSGVTHVLEAEVAEDAVDWEGTLQVNMDPGLGTEEQEVRLKKGAPIKLLGYRVKNHGFGNPNALVPLEVEAIA